MVLNIESADAEDLARQLASITGESITEVVTRALRERLDRKRRGRAHIAARLRAVSDTGRLLPRLDLRTDDEILEYDERGLPT